jgi:heme/copper-type cytochrome/quinol oxidase subunit 1
MWHGQLQSPRPYCSLSFLFVLLVGGVTGVMLAAPPVDFAGHQTYFVVANLHNVLFGTAFLRGLSGSCYGHTKVLQRSSSRRTNGSRAGCLPVRHVTVQVERSPEASVPRCLTRAVLLGKV